MTLIERSARTMIDTLSRGVPAGVPPAALAEVGAFRWRVPDEDVTLPVMTLNEAAFAHNIATINRYAAERGVWLCAHGKTMMAPQLLADVLAGERTVGLCAATLQQASVMAATGADVVFIVNQVIGRANIERLAELIEGNPRQQFLILVDSLAGIEQLLRHGAPRLPSGKRFEVLIEVGTVGGRAGVRTRQEADHVLGYLAEAQSAGAPVDLVGVSTYEGAVPAGEDWAARVDQLFALTAEVYRAAWPRVRADRLIVSAGGSATFDLVVNAAALRDLPGNPQLWLRPGVAPTYDHVVYQERLAAMDQRGGFVLDGHRASAVATFRPALALWAVVQSIPEPELAIIGAGIRDFPADAGYPTLLAQYRSGQKRREWEAGEISMVRANDQHGFLPLAGLDLEVGDVLKFGISHPCTAFDKWPVLFCVDDNERVTRAVKTYF